MPKATPQAYFTRQDDHHFAPTPHVGGAWNVEEQHIAPAIGLLAHAIEVDHCARRTDRLTIGRLSYDILGTIPLDIVSIDITVLRLGRTIELVEARLSHNGRTAILLRAWLSQTFDTVDLAHSNLPSIGGPDTMPEWDATTIWPGAFIQSTDVRRQDYGPGRASCWVRYTLPLIENEPVSPTSRAMGFVDIANGLAPLMSPDSIAFPNLDLTAHLFREPVGEWLGLDIHVSCGPSGSGLTHTILHDMHGPMGTLSQWLTVRPKG